MTKKSQIIFMEGKEKALDALFGNDDATFGYLEKYCVVPKRCSFIHCQAQNILDKNIEQSIVPRT